MHEEYPDETDELLRPWFKQHTQEEIFQMCQQNRIPFAPIYNIGELVNHPHLRERKFLLKLIIHKRESSNIRLDLVNFQNELELYSSSSFVGSG